MNIGIIGLGNMGGSIATALSSISEVTLHVSSNGENARSFAENLGANYYVHHEEVATKADILILAVKPFLFEKIIQEIRLEILHTNKLVVSIAAGISLEDLSVMFCKNEEHFNVKLLRAMPNMAARIGMSTSAICKNEWVSEQELEDVKYIFSFIGNVHDICEKDFSTFIALAGSSPAFIAMILDAFSRGGVKYGMNKEVSLEIIAESMIATATLIKEEKLNPWMLVDQVSSPGGTTVAGVIALEKAGLIPSIIEGMDATILREKRST